MALAFCCIVLRLFCKKIAKQCTYIAFAYKKPRLPIWLIIVVILIKTSTIAIGIGMVTYYDSIISYKIGIFFYIDELEIILSVICIVLMGV